MSWFEDTIRKVANNPIVKYNPVTAPLTLGLHGYDSVSGKKDYVGKEAKTRDEVVSTLSALPQQLFGQSYGQTGQDVQKVKGKLEERIDGADPASQKLKASKQGAVSQATRNLTSQGVKGGVATAAADQISRQRDLDIAASLYGQQRQNLEDYRSYLGNVISGTTALELEAQKAKNVGNMPQQSGLFGNILSGIV